MAAFPPQAVCVSVQQTHNTKTGVQDALCKGTHGPHCCFPGDFTSGTVKRELLKCFPVGLGKGRQRFGRELWGDHIDAHGPGTDP